MKIPQSWPKLPRLQTSEKFVGDDKAKDSDQGRWRDLTAYWVLGLCNNYGYVVMLSAAHDIITRLNPEDNDNSTINRDRPETERMCHVLSTGAILLADIVPSFFAKIFSPFLPFYVNIRVILACFTQFVGFVMVAFAETQSVAISGVAIMSFSSGLGEATFLSYSAKFDRNVISTWSSGTGGAGIFGSFSYAALISVGISPVNTMLIMLIVPIIEAAMFWILLRNPKSCSIGSIECNTSPNDSESGITNNELNKYSITDNIRYLPSLLKFMIPLTTVYLFEYFINQGLFELIYFKNIWIDQKAQYRWLQVDYQIGVFISRSSVNFVKINKLWILSVFQFINVVILLTEVITFFSPSIWIILAVVFFEGLLGGGAYVNTYYKMSEQVPEDRRRFALGIVSISDAIGISLAGVFAIPAHNALCKVPMPIRP